MIHHHPDDDLLFELAAGQLDSGRGFVVSAHVEGCAACARRVHEFSALGGEVLATLEPERLAPEAFARTLERIDAARPAQAKVPAGATAAARFPAEAEALLPARLLRGCTGQPWRWIGPGIRYSEIGVPHAPRSKVFLLRIAPGRTLPRHSHGGCEFTQVLSGSFSDGRAHFAGGDFDAADAGVDHQPVVSAGEECVCLAYLDAPLRFSSWIARTASRWTSFQDWRAVGRA